MMGLARGAMLARRCLARPPLRRAFAAPATLAALPRATVDGAPNDYAGVLKALAQYLDALHLRSPDTMRRVWHPSCHLKRPGADGSLVEIDAARFLEIVGEASGEAPQDQPVSDRVHGIDFAGPEAALAKLEVRLGQTTYTDFLSLLRLAEGWRIVSKLFAPRDASAVAYAETTPPATAHGEVGAVLAEYIAACRTSDGERLRAVLHPSCRTFAARRDGSLREVTAEAFVERTGSVYAPLPLGEGAARYNKVVSIDKSGPQTAAAKVQTGYLLEAGQLAVDPDAGRGEFLFTNHLLLMRLGGGWSIVSRTYSAQAA